MKIVEEALEFRTSDMYCLSFAHQMCIDWASQSVSVWLLLISCYRQGQPKVTHIQDGICL